MSQQTTSVVNTNDEYKFTHTKFCCPQCKDKNGYFSTSTFHEMMASNPESPWHGKGYKTGDQIGSCKANVHYGRGCGHEWVRTKESDKEHFVKVEVSYPVTV